MSNPHVLIAVDTTDEADEVIATGCALASGQNARLSLLTVVRPLSYLYGDMATGAVGAQYANFETELVQQAESKLKALANDHGLSPDQCHVRLGQPASEIRRYAEDHSVDTIVIGTHGRHGLGRLLGSTANGVLHGTPCNVFAVRVRADS